LDRWQKLIDRNRHDPEMIIGHNCYMF